MFIPPWLSSQPETISLQESGFMAIKYRDNNKTRFGFHAKYPVFSPDLKKVALPEQIFIEIFNIKFQWNPSSGSRADTGGPKDMTKFMVA
jgi:hypothetical protein